MVFWAYRSGTPSVERWITPQKYSEYRNKNRESCHRRYYKSLGIDALSRKSRGPKKSKGLIRKEWAKKYPDKAAAIDARRHAKRRAKTCIGTLDAEERRIITCFYEMSRRLTKCTAIPHHVDHVVPLAKGGLHKPSNLQVLTASANIRKGDKLLHAVLGPSSLDFGPYRDS